MIRFRVFAAEMKEITRAAQAADETMSTFIRHAILQRIAHDKSRPQAATSE